MARTYSPINRQIIFNSSDDENTDGSYMGSPYASANGYRSTSVQNRPPPQQITKGDWIKKQLFTLIAFIFTAVIVLYGFSWWCGDVNWNFQDDPEILEYSTHVKSKPISLAPALLWSVSFGLVVCGFTWGITYFDSAVPGVDPPTPFSPRSLRELSGHTFHMNYILGIVNGLFVAIYSFYRQLQVDEICT